MNAADFAEVVFSVIVGILGLLGLFLLGRGWRIPRARQ
jgi:hypothetical protein